MADKNSYLSRVTYKGGKDSYEFPFSYLRKDFVKAQIDVSEHESKTLAYLVDYTIDGHTIELTKPVDADKTITIYRETSSTPLVEYEDSSILRAYDLNLSQRQNLNILEEQTDIVGKNYSLSQDTKDYMYKNLMDTKTAIDNKMSETLDTVNASVSTMNDAINTATSSMDNKISQASQALEDAKANLETTKSDIEKALADTQDSMKATENRVNETKADVTKLAAELKESESSLQDAIKNINTTNRNMSYEVGDQIHSSYLPFNCYITCVTAGTTGDTLPVIPEGDHDSGFTYMDGTATFKMDYWPLSINGKKPLNKAGDITINVDKVKEAEKADSATNADKVDGYHENSFLRYRGAADADGEDTLWNQIGIKEYDEKLPKGVSGTYNFGAVVSLPAEGTRLDIWYNHHCSANGDGLWYRTGWHNDQKPWACLLDSNNYKKWAPTKTGEGASGTWGINITGNASTATNADKLDGYHASDIINHIMAANTGGIVAASLNDNGYAKFANGLILQWGNAIGQDEEDFVENSTTFPIAFPSNCFTVLLTSKRYIGGPILISQSTTHFKWEGQGDSSWAAIGN